MTDREANPHATEGLRRAHRRYAGPSAWPCEGAIADSTHGWPFVLVVLAALLLAYALTGSAQATYDPNLGRWLERDPAGYVDGMNRYQVVRSNPISSVDPRGLATVRPDMEIIELGKRRPRDRGNGFTLYGWTELREWETHFRVNRGRETFCTRGRKSLQAQELYSTVQWWYSTSRSRRHELGRVAIWQEVWSEFVRPLNLGDHDIVQWIPGTPRCYCPERARCEAKLLELKAGLHRARGILLQVEYTIDSDTGDPLDVTMALSESRMNFAQGL